MSITVNNSRLWNSLMEMAQIGPGEKGGNCRLALTPEDMAARHQLIEWCQSIGCTTRIDEVGNLFIRRQGLNPELDPVATGSHLDTQPCGGRFDGILGVLAGLEVFRTLHEANIQTQRSLELVVWTNEEGCRFAPAMLASGTYAGVFALADTLNVQDKNGVRFGDALKQAGFDGTLPVGQPKLHAFIELHIEQGPVLEEEGLSIGVVTGVQGMRWFDVTLTGSTSHAGPTPMRYRQDALAAAAHLIHHLHQHALDDRSQKSRVTFGQLEIPVASRNVVPGEVKLTVDLRHESEAELDQLQAYFETQLQSCETTFNITSSISEVWRSPAVAFDQNCIDIIEQSSQAHHYSYRHICSGAGHDSVYIARTTPTAMIFVPCLKGISHNEAEYATPEHCAQGAQVLADTLLALAERAD